MIATCDLHPHTLRAGQVALVVVDFQEAFRSVVVDFDAVARRIAVMLQGTKLLSAPVIVTEQVPGKLGTTVAEVGRLLEGVKVIEKTAFSCCAAAGFVERLEAAGARQVILCGLEAHVCVNQTAHDLLARGYQVHLLKDAVTSRTVENRQAGVEKMLRAGVIPSSVEMALFELMRDAKHEQFRAIQKLIR